MSYEDAIKLIESIEPDAPEFDIKPFDKIIYRQDTHNTSIWAPIFGHIAHNAAWPIGDGKKPTDVCKIQRQRKVCWRTWLKSTSRWLVAVQERQAGVGEKR